MFKILSYFGVNVVLLLALSQILSDFTVSDALAAAIFIVILTVLNWTVVPIIKIIAFPFNFVTFGLINLLINLITVGFAVQLAAPNLAITSEGGQYVLTLIIISVALSIGQGVVHKLSND